MDIRISANTYNYNDILINSGQLGNIFKVKDPISALTHFVGCVVAIMMTPILLIHAVTRGASIYNLVALSIFMISMILLYGASTAYHTFRLVGEAALVLKRLDHMMIFVLVAGTYTPVCLIALGRIGKIMLGIVWALAILGMIFKLVWVTCPKWVSSTMYIAMGWVVVFAFPTILQAVSLSCFLWLLIGGIMYTLGGVLYALKLECFNSRDSLWGSHEIFHLFVMVGSACHFICIYNL